METAPPLRVLHVIDSLAPSMGGLPKAAVCLAAAQAAAGAETAILHYATDQEEEEVVRAFSPLPGFSALRRIVIPDPCRREWLFGAHARREIDQFAPTVIHTHGLWEPLLRHAQDRAIALRIPHVVCPHAMLHPWHMRRRRWAKALLMRPLGWRKRWLRAAFFHAFSRDEESYLRAAGYDRVRLVPNGIFPEEDLYSQDPELPGMDGQPFVLFLSRLHPQKAPEVLVEAFERLAAEFPCLRLVLAGQDYGMRDALETFIADQGLEDRILLPGVLQGQAKWAALHQCACFCLPSRAEGFSLALLEAALAGAPILMSPGCHFDELALAGGARVCAVEPEAIATELRAILADPHAAARMGHAAQTLVRSNYTWDTAARKLLDHYRDVSRP